MRFSFVYLFTGETKYRIAFLPPGATITMTLGLCVHSRRVRDLRGNAMGNGDQGDKKKAKRPVAVGAPAERATAQQAGK